MKHKFLLIYSWFVRTILFFLPDMPLVMRLRGFLYGLGMAKSGKNIQVTHDAILRDLENMSMGGGIFIGNQSVIFGGGIIEIDSDVLIAPHCVIVSGNHISENGSYSKGKGSVGRIIIGKGAWIAANCTVAKNSILPSNSVLAANSFLNKPFEIENSIYGGVPARLIKTNKPFT